MSLFLSFACCSLGLILFPVGRSAVAATEGLFRKPRTSVGVSATVPTVSVSCGSEMPIASGLLPVTTEQTSIPVLADGSASMPQPETTFPTAPELSDGEVTDGNETPATGVTQAAVVPLDASDSDLDFGVNLSESPLTVSLTVFPFY